MIDFNIETRIFGIWNPSKKEKDYGIRIEFDPKYSKFFRVINSKDFKKAYRKEGALKSGVESAITGSIGGAGIGALTTIGLKKRLMKKGLSEDEAKDKVKKLRAKRSLIGAGIGTGALILTDQINRNLDANKKLKILKNKERHIII